MKIKIKIYILAALFCFFSLDNCNMFGYPPYTHAPSNTLHVDSAF